MARPLHPTALVTGGHQTLAQSIAHGLAQRGTRVTLGAADETAGRAAAARIGTAFARLDLTDPDSCFDTMLAHRGFDILVICPDPPRDVSLLSPRSDFALTIEGMVQAPLDLIRLNVPHWRDTGWGRIVMLSSGLSAHAEGLHGPGALGVAGAALNALTRALPRDLPPGVKINAACPQVAPPQIPADTPIWLATLPEDGPTGGFFRARHPISW